MKVLVFGAAGSQQFPVIAALQKRGAAVIANTHSNQNVERLQSTGAEVVVADMANRERIFEITKDVDAISFLVPFFLQNPNDGLQYAKNVIDAAIANGVSHLVWNTSGFILPYKIGNPAMDVRIDIAQYLKESGLPHIIIQPSVYAENLLGPWTAPFVKHENKVLYPTPEEMPVGWIPTIDVAEFVAQAIFTPALVGQSFLISGNENLQGNALAEKFSIGLNKQIQYAQMPPKEFGAILDQMFGAGAGKGAEDMYQGITDSKQYPLMFNPNMQEVLRALPIEMTPMETWVRNNQAAFLY